MKTPSPRRSTRPCGFCGPRSRRPDGPRILLFLSILSLTLLLGAGLLLGCGDRTAPPAGEDDPASSRPADADPLPSEPSPEPTPEPSPDPQPDEPVTDGEVLMGKNETYGGLEKDETLLYRLVNSRFYEVVGTQRDDPEIVIPSEFNGMPVKRIRGSGKAKGSGAFFGRDIVTVTVAEGVIAIDDGAFEDCANLQKVVIPSTVRRIGKDAFPGCTALEEVSVEGDTGDLISIDGVLYGEKGKTLLFYPYGKKDAAFTVPEEVKKIDAIENNPNLTALTLPEGLTKIGSLADLPLSSLDLPDSLTSIEKINRLPLVTLRLPKNISAHGFLYTAELPALAAITVDEESPNYMAIDGVLFDKTGETLYVYPPAKPETSYTVPEGVKKVSSIKNNPFLTSLTLPEGVEKVNMLSDLPLTSLTLPDSLTEIDLQNLPSLPALHIPKGVLRLNTAPPPPGADSEVYYSSFEKLSSLVSITVAEENPAYKAVDGVLFDKSGETLLLYPPARPDTSYVVPDGVVTFAYRRFVPLYLKTLTLPSTLVSLPMFGVVLPGGGTVFVPASVQEIAQHGIHTTSQDAPLTVLCQTQKQPEGWAEGWCDSESKILWGMGA